jgi:hypothetical protein
MFGKRVKRCLVLRFANTVVWFDLMHLYQLRKGRDWIILLIMIQYGLAEDIDLRVKEIIRKIG